MKLLERIADLLFPERLTCNICGREIFDGGYLCEECAKTVKFNDKATCPVCGRATTYPALCLECKDKAPPYKKAVSATIYDGGAARLILAFKSGSPHLKRYFAELLEPKCRQLEGADSICYVPMTAKAKRKRGYNQSEILARELSKRLNLPVIKGAVVKKRETKSQKTLSFKDRAQNLKGSFTAYKDKVNGKSIILVDDVLTTGATAETITRELLKKGAKCVYLATVASVEFKRPL